MIFAAFLALAFVAYLPCWRGPVIFDAMEAVKESQAWQWSWSWYKQRYGRCVPYRLLSVVVWAADLWRVGAMGQAIDRCEACRRRVCQALHFSNVVLHAVNSWIVAEIAGTWVAGAIYAVHPFAANTVGNLTGKASLVSGTLGLAAILAVVSGHPWMVFPLLGLAFLGKEDGVGYGATCLVLMFWKGHDWWAVGLWAVGMVLFLAQMPKWRDYVKRNGDEAMAAGGLPVSLPFRDHGYTVAVETLIRVPQWAFGVGMSPYHGSGVPVPGLGRLALAIVVLASLMLLPTLPIILILTGPWLVYVVCRVPDQLMEYRNYLMVAGFAMMFAAMPFGYALIPLFLAITLVRALPWSYNVDMWKEAVRCASGDPSRAYQEIGAWLKLTGKGAEAEGYLKEAVRWNPRLAAAWDNLAFVYLERGETDKGVAALEHCTVACPQYPLAFEELGTVYQQQGKLEEAEACYQRAITLAPSHALTNRIGLIRFHQRKYNEAFHWFRKAMNQAEWYPYAWNCSMALKWAGDLDKATEYQKKVKELCPGDILGTYEMIRPDYQEVQA